LAGDRNKRSFCLRSDVAWDVRKWIADKVDASKAVENLQNYAAEPSFLSDLQTPVHFGDKAEAVNGSASNRVRYKRMKDPMAEAGGDEQAGIIVAVGTG